MNFNHVSSIPLRRQLSLPESDSVEPPDVDYVVAETLTAFAADESDPELESFILYERERFINRIVSHYGDGEDGNAIAFNACRSYWSV